MAKKDAISLLKEDHQMVKRLLSDLQRAAERNGAKQGELLQRITAALQTHTRLEEEIFYPAFHAAVDKEDDAKLYYEALEEHHVVDLVLPEMTDAEPGSEEFAAKVKVLKDLVEHHVEEEEGRMFPRASKAIDKEDLKQLGERLERRRDQLRRPGSQVPVSMTK
jgi:hemerythrin superfamily protein